MQQVFKRYNNNNNPKLVFGVILDLSSDLWSIGILIRVSIE